MKKSTASNVGRPSKAEEHKKKKVSVTLNPRLHAAAVEIQEAEGISLSELLERALSAELARVQLPVTNLKPKIAKPKLLKSPQNRKDVKSA